MQIKKKGQEGFTLIELLVVVVIIGILSSVAVPNFMGAQDKAKNSGVQSNAHTVQMALEQFAVDNAGSYPADGNFSDMGDYLGANLPKTPWNTQQSSASIPAFVAGEVTKTVMGNGTSTMAAAVTNLMYGSVHYTRTGSANERYQLSATGKKGNSAIKVFGAQNF